MLLFSTQYVRGFVLAGVVATCAGCGSSPGSAESSSGGASSQGGLAVAGSVSVGEGGSASGGGAVGGGAGGGAGAAAGTGGSSVGGVPTSGGGGASVGRGGAAAGGTAAGGMAPVSGGAFTGGGGITLGVGGKGTSGAFTAGGGITSGVGGEGTGGDTASVGGAGTGGDTPGTGGSGAGGDASGVGGAHSSVPSSGCSLTSVAVGTTLDNTMNVPGQSTLREYRLSVPSDYVPGEPLPVVFVLNGVGGTGPQAQQFFQVETGHRAIFVYPTSLPNDEAGGSIAWDFSLTGVDVPFFDSLLSYLEESYCVDTSRIFVLGASSGGIMSNMLGCFRGDVIRAIAPSSGMTWQQSGCQGDVAVMVICGEQDSYNACDDSQNGGLSQTNVWVPLNGCSQPAQTAQSQIADICQDYQGCRSGEPLLLCRHAGGHGWPTADGDFWWQFFMSLE